MAKRRRLTKAIVVDTAAQMADAAGRVDAVTLTALAAALGVRVPSLYNHVASLDDLHHALTVESVRRLNGVFRDASMGKTGVDALLAMAHAYRRFAHAHPGIYALTVRGPEPDDEELGALVRDLLQTVLLVMASVGLHGDDALHAMRGFRSILHGFCSLETVEGFRLALDADESFRRLVATFMAGLGSGAGGSTQAGQA
ncbi:MAG: WHG domain-containing protein [Caldilineaceae bacterium]|nr:WHG domain-containing protein [Caldilineaceae bacterium]